MRDRCCRHGLFPTSVPSQCSNPVFRADHSAFRASVPILCSKPMKTNILRDSELRYLNMFPWTMNIVKRVIDLRLKQRTIIQFWI